MQRLSYQRLLFVVIAFFIGSFAVYQNSAEALNVAHDIHSYSDLITNSRPDGNSNHTFAFQVKQSVAAGGYLDFDWPAGFDLPATSTFDVRNVEMYVNGVPRTASSTLSASSDQVIIATGAGGSIRYNLNTTAGISTDDNIEFRVGNHTSTAFPVTYTYSTSTGTTTIPGDPAPIKNPSSVGNQLIALTFGGASSPMNANFYITIITPMSIAGVDTTETVPPFRFNGAPSGEIGGTTLYVEISLETDEFAWCRFSQTASTSFYAMGDVFENTGLIVHTHEVEVIASTTNTYYVRCIDDEGNFNIDDYIISFFSPGPPSGTSNTDGGTEGDGTGTGDSETGEEGGGSGSTGNSGGSGSGGGSSGSGGSGGGSGGSSGEDDDDETGGGFESSAGPYPSGDAEVIIRGYAFPRSTVYALVDGYVAESERADSDGEYSITVTDISRGVYTFGVYAIDDDGTKSTTFSTSFTVTGGKTSNLSNINIMPSILVEPDPVDVGQNLAISGYSIPDATVTLENQKDGSSVSLKTFTTTSDNDGAWSVDVDTSNFSGGTYKVHAKADNGAGLKTNFSDYTYYGVGQEAVSLNADLNRDGKVNLTDFSILLFWWGSDGGSSDPPADINQDDRVSLTDFSILLFQWTG